VHVEKFFARNWEVSSMPGLVCRPAREGQKPHAEHVRDEKSDEAILPAKRLNKGGNFRGSRGGRPHPREQPTGGRGSDTEPSCHVDPIGGCAPERMWFQAVRAADVRPEEEPGALAAPPGSGGGEEHPRPTGPCSV